MIRVEFEFMLRSLGKYGSSCMDDAGMNWWNEICGRKREHPENIHTHGVCPPHGMSRDRSDDIYD